MGRRRCDDDEEPTGVAAILLAVVAIFSGIALCLWSVFQIVLNATEDRPIARTASLLVLVGGIGVGIGFAYQRINASNAKPASAPIERPTIADSPLSQPPPSKPKRVVRNLPSQCGRASAPRGVDPQTWGAYTCQSQTNAGDWSACVARTSYTDKVGQGCPGEERCCPGVANVPGSETAASVSPAAAVDGSQPPVVADDSILVDHAGN